MNYDSFSYRHRSYFSKDVLDVCNQLVNIIMLMFQIKIMSICGLALVLFSSKHSHD